MPYFCKRCDYFSESEETCPTCGATMTYTILGGLEVAEKKQRTVKVDEGGTPSLFQRIGQLALGLIWAHIVASVLVTAFVAYQNANGVKPREIQEKSSLSLSIAVIVIPMLAIALAASISLRKVYLSQLVGLALGILTGLLFVSERIAFGMAPAFWEWLVLPVLGGGIGFVAGLRVAGKYEASREMEYQPIDSWDETSTPKLVFIDMPPQQKWIKVIKAILFAILFHMVWWGGFELLHWIHVFGENRLTGIWRDLNLSKGEIIAFVLGGIFAGARTNTGIMQGLLYGLGMSAYHLSMTAFLETKLPMDLAITLSLSFVFGGIIAALFGTFAAPATKNYVNRQE